MVEVCFRIEGEWLTETARQRVIEDRFDHGFNILYEGLMGITTDQVLTILRGDAKLVGTNDVDMIFEDDQEWKKKLDYHYAGTWITPDGRYYRPYAVVTSWGSDDMIAAERITQNSDSMHRKTGTFAEIGGELAGRNLFYADDPDQDVVKSVRYKTNNPDIAAGRDGTVAVLYKEIRNYPFQLKKAYHNAQEALDAFVATGRYLEIRGYAQTFPKDWFKVRYESDALTDPAPLTRSHFDMEDYASERDAKTNVIFNNKKKDAKLHNMTMGEFEEFQNVMNNADNPFQRRVEAMNKAFEIQRTIEDRIPAWREEIIKLAGDNWIELNYNDKIIKIPQAPFENWCLWRTDGAHLAMPWERVAPSGVKMFGDDPYHTDFLIGAGLAPDAMMNDNTFSEAIFNLRHKIQEEKMGFKCAVLSGRGYIRGTIVHVKTGDEEIPDDAIVVTKSAAAKHIDVVLKARAVIVERGGAMAHLVTLAREQEAVIVRVPDALKIYPNGSSVTVNADKGEVILHEGNMKAIWDEFL